MPEEMDRPSYLTHVDALRTWQMAMRRPRSCCESMTGHQHAESCQAPDSLTEPGLGGHPPTGSAAASPRG